MNDIKIIQDFILENHLLTLATINDNLPWCASLFYAFDKNTNTLVVASDEKTKHIQDTKQNKNVSGTIAPQTKQVSNIQGLQFRGKFYKNHDKNLKNIYFKKHPYALALNPTLWQIKLTYLKYTDNKIFFAKKLIIDLETSQ